jgi:hypothetical protein
VDLKALYELRDHLARTRVHTPETLRGAIAEDLKDMSAAEVEDVAALLSALSARTAAERAKLLPALVRAVGIEADDDFLKAVGEVASTEPLKLHGRGVGLSYEYPNVLISARILTDIRPVFSPWVSGDDEELSLEAGMVMHTLKVDYVTPSSSSAADSESIFLGADKRDLLQFQELIERALKKHDLLDGLLAKAELPIIEPWLDSQNIERGGQ